MRRILLTGLLSSGLLVSVIAAIAALGTISNGLDSSARERDLAAQTAQATKRLTLDYERRYQTPVTVSADGTITLPVAPPVDPTTQLRVDPTLAAPVQAAALEARARADEQRAAEDQPGLAARVAGAVWAPFGFLLRWTLVPIVIVGAAAAALGIARLRRRASYPIERFPLEMGADTDVAPDAVVRLIANLHALLRREWWERALTFQPWIALELHHRPFDGQPRVEWVVACHRSLLPQVDRALASVYAGARLGKTYEGQYRTLQQYTRTEIHRPRAVRRLVKDRSLAFALQLRGDVRDEVFADTIAHAMGRAPGCSAVQLILTPANPLVARFARSRYRRHENKVVRAGTYGLPEAGLQGPLDQRELRAGAELHTGARLCVEIRVVADDEQSAAEIAATLTAAGGDNSLHEQTFSMAPRQGTHLDRFLDATPAPLPNVVRGVYSAAEVAVLWSLPSNNPEGVRHHRSTIPRLAIPAEMLHVDPERPPATFPADPTRVSLPDLGERLRRRIQPARG
ncbi:hypothetical protein GKE82_23725 [Conexibacter sp. W3-3-2]|uniref:hypothetical protein n=1 Tax=Conexibacter sp. W3-3-2 TaxID=2675227 RepID=UPI0012B945E2|nr:hypothetical protein [Conexibacter sp. W3-3-2]MTD47216.1 hypothetical protein [Conexibacter sp. W3-3-2]